MISRRRLLAILGPAVGLGGASAIARSTNAFGATGDALAYELAKQVLGVRTLGTATTSYTLASGDAGFVVEATSSSPVTVRIPSHTSVPFPTRTVIEVCQCGSGIVSVVATTGVTIRATGSTSTASTWKSLRLRKRSTNEWVVE